VGAGDPLAATGGEGEPDGAGASEGGTDVRAGPDVDAVGASEMPGREAPAAEPSGVELSDAGPFDGGGSEGRAPGVGGTMDGPGDEAEGAVGDVEVGAEAATNTPGDDDVCAAVGWNSNTAATPSTAKTPSVTAIGRAG